MDNQNKNLILATVLSFLVLVGWFFLFPPPKPEPRPEVAQTEATVAGETAAPGALPAETIVSREEVLTRSERVPVKTARLGGSIALTGGRIDDLNFLDYFETIQPGSPPSTCCGPRARRGPTTRSTAGARGRGSPPTRCRGRAPPGGSRAARR